jgi:hypothetical protein
VELIFAEIRASLAAIGVEFDVYFSERRLHERGELAAAVARLDERGHVYRADGAVWVASSAFGDDKDRAIVRSDRTYSYFAADCAYYLDKRGRGFSKVLIVLGADHHGYAGQMRAMAVCFGDDPDTTLEILICQLVSLLRDAHARICSLLRAAADAARSAASAMTPSCSGTSGNATRSRTSATSRPWLPAPPSCASRTGSPGTWSSWRSYHRCYDACRCCHADPRTTPRPSDALQHDLGLRDPRILRDRAADVEEPAQDRSGMLGRHLDRLGLADELVEHGQVVDDLRIAQRRRARGGRPSPRVVPDRSCYLRRPAADFHDAGGSAPGGTRHWSCADSDHCAVVRLLASRFCLSAAMLPGISLRASRRITSGTRILPMP